MVLVELHRHAQLGAEAVDVGVIVAEKLLVGVLVRILGGAGMVRAGISRVVEGVTHLKGGEGNDGTPAEVLDGSLVLERQGGSR